MAEIKKIKVGSLLKYLRTVDNKGNQNIILRPENLQLHTPEWYNPQDPEGDPLAFMGYFFALATPSNTNNTYTSTITINFDSKSFYGFLEQLKIAVKCSWSGTGLGFWMLDATITYGGEDEISSSHYDGISPIYIGVDTQFNLIFKWTGTPVGMDTTKDSTKIIIKKRDSDQVISLLADNYIVPTDGEIGWMNIWSLNSDYGFGTLQGTGYVYQEGLEYD